MRVATMCVWTLVTAILMGACGGVRAADVVEIGDVSRVWAVSSGSGSAAVEADLSNDGVTVRGSYSGDVYVDAGGTIQVCLHVPGIASDVVCGDLTVGALLEMGGGDTVDEYGRISLCFATQVELIIGGTVLDEAGCVDIPIVTTSPDPPPEIQASAE